MLALHGRIVTFDPARPLVEDGALYVGDDGLIDAVSARTDPPPSGFGGVTPIETAGVIYPGLIDLHSHLLYNLRSLWSPPRAKPFTSHEQWPNSATYQAEITAPAKVWSRSPAAREVLAFAEAKAIVGGTTAIQGAPATTRPYEGFLVRNVDNESFGTRTDPVTQSVATLDVEALHQREQQMSRGTAFVYHLAEGTSPALLHEYEHAFEAGCLRPELVAIHATALGPDEFGRWSPQAGSVVWSPFSNLWLYRATTDVVAARDKGIRICLGSDWSPSGSKNVLGELKVADLWNREHLGGAFSDAELCAMVTANPADALGPAWSGRTGRLRAGLEADVLVIEPRRPDPYRNLIESREAHVRLVLVGGKARYGLTALMEAASAEAAEPIPQAGRGRRISLAGGQESLTWHGVLANLEAVRADPGGEISRANLERTAGLEPFELVPDMPEGSTAEGLALSDPASVTIPPLDTLRHDPAFFDELSPERAPILNGLLAGLIDYYHGR